MQQNPRIGQPYSVSHSYGSIQRKRSRSARYIDGLYDLVEDNTIDPRIQAEAQSEIRELHLEMARGLRSRGKRPFPFTIMQCRKCGAIVENVDLDQSPCPKCGFDSVAETRRKIESGQMKVGSE